MKSIDLRDMLGALGYSKEHFSENYSVQIDGTSAVKFDYVAFSDRYLKDISTSCIVIQEVQDVEEEIKYVESAKYLAAPIALIAKDTSVRVWNITPQKPTLLSENDTNIIYLYFEKNRFEFMSDTLIDAKMGYRQLDIFEATGLIDFSREATCKILSDEFEKGLMAAKKYIKTKKNINGQDLNNITSITMHVLSALIINSKVMHEDRVPDILELITTLAETYKEYFSSKLMLKYGKELLIEIYDNLNKSINYQSVDHELLGYFYESTLLQLNEKKAENIRKEFGIYYTPRTLSQELAASIPFENIPVDERYVLDGTCGSGSLLLSACKRLEELVSYEKVEFDRHDYLTKMLEGYDIDKFASEVARLSLLLYSLPYGNKWKIRAGDLLRINKSKIQAPSVILGNPPYEEVRGNSQKTQKATAFLDKYLEWLCEDGYIGIILPESFLQNDSATQQREKLLKEFDIFELWMLPGQIFENNCATIVLIAQKRKPQNGNVTKIKVLVRNKESVKRYFKQRTWDFEFLVDIQKKWKETSRYKMCVSPVEDILQKIEKNSKTIGNSTKNIMGIMLPSDYNVSKLQFDGWVPYIANGNQFRKYVISSEMRDNVGFVDYHMSEEKERKLKEQYKGLRLRRKHEDKYAASNKVLVKMSSTPGEIDCIGAFVDEEGCYPSHSFFVILSEEERVSNYVLCTLLNSKIINAYVRRACVKRTLTTEAVKSIPIPDFSEAHIRELEQCYRNIKLAYMEENEEKASEIQEEIDDIIFDAFELEEEECERVRKLYEVYEGHGNSSVPVKEIRKKYYNVSGQVEKIDFEKGYCTVCLAEFGEREIKLDKEMPGWFLRHGAEFSGKYFEEKLFDLKPLMYSYLDDEGIVELLSKEFLEY